MANSSTFHVLPNDDSIEHEEEGEDCPCGPRSESVLCDDGTWGLLVVHNSLDGRELNE
jgi:hypothetical protein